MSQTVSTQIATHLLTLASVVEDRRSLPETAR
jgi:hypothetical protein